MIEINKQKVFQYFTDELYANPQDYLDSSNCVNLTKLTESYLNNHPEIEMDSPEEDEIFELSSEWFDLNEEKLNLKI